MKFTKPKRRFAQGKHDVVVDTPPPDQRNRLVSGGLVPPPLGSIEGDATPDPLHAFSAGLSVLTYADVSYIKTVLEKEGALHIEAFHENLKPELSHTFGIGFVLDRRAWIGFCGSNDREDWAQNCLAMPGYHFGFQSIWSGVGNEVLDWAAGVADEVDSVVLTGHSLGGGIATLASYDLARENDVPVEALITFAAPRVGSPFFASRYNEQSCNLVNQPQLTLGDVTIRYVAKGDLVPRVPTALMFFKHVGSPQDVGWTDDQPLGSSQTVYTSAIALNPSELPLKSRLMLALTETLESTPVVPMTMFLSAALGTKSWGKDRALDHAKTRYAGFFGEDYAFRDALVEFPQPASNKKTSWLNRIVLGIIGFFLALVLLAILALGVYAVISTGEMVLVILAIFVGTFFFKFSRTGSGGFS